jgi:hypothetical protein
MAAAAGSEVWTLGRYSLWRCRDDLVYLCLGKAALLFRKVSGNRLTGQSKRDEESLARFSVGTSSTGQAIAAIHSFFHNQLHACLM